MARRRVRATPWRAGLHGQRPPNTIPASLDTDELRKERADEKDTSHPQPGRRSGNGRRRRLACRRWRPGAAALYRHEPPFHRPDTTAGTFVVSGAVADSGAAEVRDLTITPGSADSGRLSGTETYNGQQGTIVTRFQGVAFPLSSPHGVGIGQFEIVSGTGAYAGLGGHGTFEIVVDKTTNQLIGTEIASVR